MNDVFNVPIVFEIKVPHSPNSTLVASPDINVSVTLPLT